MRDYVIRRILISIILLVGITLILFVLINVAPGDPLAYFIDPDDLHSIDDLERIREVLGLNRPIYVRYGVWLQNILRGNLGHSISFRRPVSDLILQRLPYTIQLQLLALISSLIISLAVGIYSAVNQYSLGDHVATMGAFLGLSLPNFWFGLILMLFFSVHLRWLPTIGTGHERSLPFLARLKYFVLPTTVLATASMAKYTRFMRSSMLEVIRQDYIRTARSKGLSERVVLYKHALRNALIPMVTVVGMSISVILGGSVIVESIFGWPGIGTLALEAVYRRDYPLIMGVTGMTALMVVTTNLLVDVVYVLVDPRISYH